MIKKINLLVIFFLISLSCTAVNNISKEKSIESWTREIRNLNLQKSKIDETRTDFNYFLNLAINNRPDLKPIKEQLASSSYNTLNNSSQEKLKSVINEINIKYKIFHILLKQRGEISNSYQNIIEQITELEAKYNRNSNLEKINKKRDELKKVRKQLIQEEKKLAKARLGLYESCGISARQLQRPSTATINQAQRDYVKAQKGYIRSVLGISDDKANLNSSIGSPISY